MWVDICRENLQLARRIPACHSRDFRTSISLAMIADLSRDQVGTMTGKLPALQTPIQTDDHAAASLTTQIVRVHTVRQFAGTARPTS